MSISNYPIFLFKLLFKPRRQIPLSFPEVGWTITIPKKFHLMSAKEMLQMDKRHRGKMAIITGENLPTYQVQGQFWTSYEIQNLFGCGITDLDQTHEPEWRRKNDSTCNNMLNYYHAIYKEYAHIEINTVQETRQKGDVIFETFDIIATIPGREVHRTRYYSTKRKNYGIFITMSFADAKAGEDMLDILRASTFS